MWFGSFNSHQVLFDFNVESTINIILIVSLDFVISVTPKTRLVISFVMSHKDVRGTSAYRLCDKRERVKHLID